ncbi:MAG: response regulator [Candidatus Competibacteraceae bacterium]|nr:response regulator [Candidatus Competibacteraceae bacterium]
MNTDIPLRILFVEDVPADAELAARILSKEGLAFTSIRVETQEEFLNALIEYRPDLILSDYSLPQFDGMRALRLALAHNVNLPFIIVTGSIDEETAVDCIKAGAWDYVLKERMARLPFAAKSALERRKIRLSQAESAVMLRESERRYREIFNATNEAIFIDDAATGQMIDVNDAMLRMYGYSSKQEVLAGSIGDLSANRPPIPKPRRSNIYGEPWNRDRRPLNGWPENGAAKNSGRKFRCAAPTSAARGASWRWCVTLPSARPQKPQFTTWPISTP